MKTWQNIAAAALALAALNAAADTPGYGPVGGETLWTVAGKINKERHLGTTAQLAWALFRTNPDAFEGTPDKLKPGAMLKVPEADAVTVVSNAEAYEKLTGKAAVAKPAGAVAAPVASATQAPAAAPPRPAKPARAAAPPPASPANPHELPVIAGVELKPVANGKQWLGVVGSGFRPGAKLELHDLLGDAKFSAQAPAKLTSTRIDYLAKVGGAQSNWLLTVRNADGTQTEPYGFAAGPGAQSTISAPPPPEQQPSVPAAAAAVSPSAPAAPAAPAAQAAPAEPAKTEAERDAEEQAANLKLEAERLAAEKAAMDKAAADKAALDREFDRKMAADKAAYDKAHPAKGKKKKKP